MPVPSYPEDLKKEGIGGELKLRLTIGKDGKVEDIVVTKSVYPYLDYTAVSAFRDGTFEPVVKDGKPVRAAFDFSYLFDPSSGPALNLESPEIPGNRGEIDRILAGCAEYCRKLREAALYFVCQETIDEIHYQLNPDIRHADLNFTSSQILADYSNGGQLAVMTDVQIMDPNRTERNSYVCDYQLIRNAETIKEKRALLKENGRKTPDPAKLLDEKRFSILVPMTLPLRLFDHARQPLFDFRIQGTSGINGRKAWVLEAVSKSGSGEWIQKARIWVDRQSFQILKSEIEGVPIEGYEDVLSDSVRLNIQPDFQMTNEFSEERNGVMFPDKTTVQVRYRGIGRPILKLKSTFKYNKYRFFSVETEHEIIK